MVLFCAEAGRELAAGERQLLTSWPVLLVRTKVDLSAGGDGIAVSTVTGEGLDTLRRALLDRLFTGGERYADLEPMLTRERHRAALDRARNALVEAAPHLAADGDAVLAAHHVRMAVTALDELIGVVDVNEVLDRVFERFCVGK